MARQYRVRDNPVGSFFGGIIGLAFGIFGLSMMPSEAGAFKLLWVSAAFIISGLHFYNALSRRGIAREIIEAPDDDDDDRYRREHPYPSRSTPDAPLETNAESRLRTLNDLLAKNLISRAEYEQQRQEIVRNI